MTSVLVNVGIGLATSIVSGVCVWLWQRAKVAGSRHRTAAFFGLSPGATCVLIMNHHAKFPLSMHHKDVRAFLGIAGIAYELDAEVEIVQPEHYREGIGGRVEFCLGGPDSNTRTAGHLASWLPGVRFGRHGEPDSRVVTVGTHRFERDPGTLEYAVLAKFTPAGGAPVFLISGQTAVTNEAAVRYLHREHGSLRRDLPSTGRFCLALAVDSPDVYGPEQVRLAADLSDVAFTAAPA